MRSLDNGDHRGTLDSMSRAAVLALAIIASCCADDDAGKTLVASAGGEDSSSSAGEEGTTDADGESSGDPSGSSSTGDPDACPDWCGSGCPFNSGASPWVGQQGLCACSTDDDCWPDGMSIGLTCVGYDPGVDPGHTHQLGRCVPVE